MADGFILVQTHSIPTTHPAGLPGMFAKHANGVVNAFRNDTLLLIDEVRLLLKSDETKDATDKTEQPNRRRRSSSLKRMSSIFGDWRAQSSHGVQPDALDTIQEQDPPPSKDALREMLNMNVLDRYRTKVPFNSLVKDGVQRRTVVVFIRHFFCGNCFGYVRALTNEMPVAKLAAYDPTVRLIVIGCGDPVLIPNYVKMTDCPFEIYADPSRELYKRMDFTVNALPIEKKAKYIEKWSPPSLVKNILMSLGLAARARSKDAGKVTQNGGEVIWSNGELEYIHRMKHPGDHIETEDLDRLLKLRTNL